MAKVCDIDQAGNVLCTYNGSAAEGIVATKTKVPPAKALLYAFLPAGYPHSVTDDYLPYQTFDSLQAFSSSIASLLANRAVLEGLGVGDASSSPTAALVLQIIQDTFSRLATIIFAHRMGQAIEPECKSYRFMADVFNDTALLLDLLVPVLPLFPKVSVMVSASILRSLCGVAAGASKASLSAHFATKGNLAELNAKEASQETVVSLLGMMAGTAVVHLVHDKRVVWCWMLVLVAVHLWMNYSGVRAVKMLSLNRQRATIVFREWLSSGRVFTPTEVAQRERILRGGWGRLTSENGAYTGLCNYGTYGAVVGWQPRGYQRRVHETDAYFMGIYHSGANFNIRIALKHSSGGGGGIHDAALGPLLAWLDAVTHAYYFEKQPKDAPNDYRVIPQGVVPNEEKEYLLQELRTAGWNLEDNQLETSDPVRVRLAEDKKDM